MNLKIASLMVVVAVSSTGFGQVISKAKRAELKKAGLIAYLPTSVPKGFTIRSFGVETGTEKMLRGYTVEYVGPKGAEFTVQAASDGLGDAMFTVDDGDVVDPTGSIKVKTKVLGTMEIELYFKGKYRKFHSQWKETPKSHLPRNFMIYGSNMTEAQIKAIYSSLAVV